MQNLHEELKNALAKDERLVFEGQLVKNKIVELALKLDASLLKCLLASEPIKKHFFEDVEGILVFDKIKFQKFVSNKAFLPDSYTAFKNKIGLIATDAEGLYDQFLTDSREVVLAFPHKDTVLEGGQTKEEREARTEIFWNETLAPDDIDRLKEPKVLTNFKRYTKDGATPLSNLSKKDNFIIKGNNLLALHSLEKVYAGQIKLIYIDPPYNTKNDSFAYNDNFNHSAWLTFMKNRLEVAKNLLKREGIFCMNIDDKEIYYVKVLCDEIFGKNNFLTTITVKTSDPSGHKTVNPAPYSQSEYVLMYAKNKSFYKYDTFFVESDYDSGYSKFIENITDNYASWKIENLNEVVALKNGYEDTKKAKKALGEAIFTALVAEFALRNKEKVFQLTAISDDAGKEIVALRDKSSKNKDEIFCVERMQKESIFITSGRQIYFYSSKVKKIDGKETPAKPLTNIWTDIPYNGIAKEGGVSFKNGKKPEKLLRRLIEVCTKPNEIVLDFHVGSGTTAAVAHKMNRQYIGIEQLDYIEELPTVRLENVILGEQSGISKIINWQGGGEFVYCELKKYNQDYVDAINTADTEESLSDLWAKMQNAAFISHKIDVSSVNKNIKDFEVLPIEDKKRFLIEVLDKNLLYVPFSERNNGDYAVSDADKRLSELFYSMV
jgi:adenine-specific DNA-methyltransferase